MIQYVPSYCVNTFRFSVLLEKQTRDDPDLPLQVIRYDGAAYRSQLLKGPGKKYPAVTLVLSARPYTISAAV